MNKKKIKKVMGMIQSLHDLRRTDPHDVACQNITQEMQNYLLSVSDEELLYHPLLKISVLQELLNKDLSDLIEYLLQQRPDLNITSIPIAQNGDTLLQVLIERIDFLEIYWPIFKKYDFAMDYSELIAVIASFTEETRVLELVHYFLKQYPDYDLSKEIYFYPLNQNVSGAILAAQNGYPQVLKIFLDNGAKLRLSVCPKSDVQKRRLDSLLESAIRAKRLDIDRSLAVDIKKYTSIIDIIFEHLERLKKKNADPSFRIPTDFFYRNESTPLHSTSIQRHPTIFLKTLIASLSALKKEVIEYDLNASNMYGQTPLHIALQENMDESIISSLIKQGARVDLRDFEGKHAFFFLKRSSQSDKIAQILFDTAKKSLSKEDFQDWLNVPVSVHPLIQPDVFYYYQISGSTVLHHAVFLQSTELVELCIDEGSNLAMRNGLDLTPFDFSCIYPKRLLFSIPKLLHYAMKERNISIYHRIHQEKSVLDEINLAIAEQSHNPDYLHGKTLLEMTLEKGYHKEFGFLVAQEAVDAELAQTERKSPFIHLLDCASRHTEGLTHYPSDFFSDVGYILSEYPEYHDYFLSVSELFENREKNAFYQMVARKEFLLLLHILDYEKNIEYVFEKAPLYVLEEYCKGLIEEMRSLGKTPAQFRSDDDQIIAFHLNILKKWLHYRAHNGLDLLSQSDTNLLRITLPKENRGFEELLYKNIALLMKQDSQKHSFFHQKENVFSFVKSILALTPEDRIDLFKTLCLHGLLDLILKNPYDSLELYAIALHFHSGHPSSHQSKKEKKDYLTILADHMLALGVSYEWSLHDSFEQRLTIVKHQMALEMPFSHILIFLQDKECVLNEQQFLCVQRSMRECNRKKYSQIYHILKKIYDRNLLRLCQQALRLLSTDLFDPQKSPILDFIKQYDLQLSLNLILALIVLSEESYDYSLEISLKIEDYSERFLWSASSELSRVFSGLSFDFREKIYKLQECLYDLRTQREQLENNAMHAQEKLSVALLFRKPSAVLIETAASINLPQATALSLSQAEQASPQPASNSHNGCDISAKKKVCKEKDSTLKKRAQFDKHCMTPLQIAINQSCLSREEPPCEKRSSASQTNKYNLDQSRQINHEKTQILREILNKTELPESISVPEEPLLTSRQSILSFQVDQALLARPIAPYYFPDRYCGPCTVEEMDRLIKPYISYEVDRSSLIREKAIIRHSLRTMLESWSKIKNAFTPEKQDDFDMVQMMQILEREILQAHLIQSSRTHDLSKKPGLSQKR